MTPNDIAGLCERLKRNKVILNDWSTPRYWPCALSAADAIIPIILSEAANVAREWEAAWQADARKLGSEFHEAGAAVADQIATAIEALGENS